jgi:hypothetical protein
VANFRQFEAILATFYKFESVFEKSW